VRPPSLERFLLVRAGARVCALPITAVVETMRPLPVSPVAGVPPFVQGVAIVRGEPVPVLDLAAFLGDGAPAAPSRFVTVRAGPRTAALAVGDVVGVAPLDPGDATRLPLLADACAGAVEALRARDADLVVVLRVARLVPDEVHRALAQRGAGA
jgi:purine-binding chemotaxis protein CheW